MTLLDLRASRIDIRETVGDDLSIVVTVTNAAGTPIDVSAYTIVADVYRNGTPIDTFTDVVSGASSNIVTLSLTDAQTTTIGNQGGLTWSMSVTIGTDVDQWFGGDFQLYTVGHPKAGTSSSTAVTVQVGGAITTSVSIGEPGATGATGLQGATGPPGPDGATGPTGPVNTSSVAKAGDTMTGALTLPSDPAGSLDAATKQYVDNFGLGGSPASTAGAVSIADSGGYYISTDVEAALAEIPMQYPHRARLAPMARAHKITQDGGQLRVGLIGTSIASFAYALPAIGELLKTSYGVTPGHSQQAGALGGSYNDPYLGWEKQPFSGRGHVRIRGKAASSDMVLYTFGDTLELWFSREANSEACDILIDGVVVGTTPAAGGQVYAVKQKFSGLGVVGHTLTISKPAGAGYVYFEAYQAYDSTTPGVLVQDWTLGGSNWGGTNGTPNAPVGAQVAGIATTAAIAVNGWVDNDDIDLYLFMHDVNDVLIYNTTFRPSFDLFLAKTREKAVPVVLVSSMAGHFSMPARSGYVGYNYIRSLYKATAAAESHVTHLDWHGATVLADLGKYASLYYSSVAGLNVAAGTYSSGDFIHPDKTAHGPLQHLFSEVFELPPGKATINARMDRWAAVSTTAPGVGVVERDVYRLVETHGAITFNATTDVATTTRPHELKVGSYLVFHGSNPSLSGHTGQPAWVLTTPSTTTFTFSYISAGGAQFTSPSTGTSYDLRTTLEVVSKQFSGVAEQGFVPKWYEGGSSYDAYDTVSVWFDRDAHSGDGLALLSDAAGRLAIHNTPDGTDKWGKYKTWDTSQNYKVVDHTTFWNSMSAWLLVRYSGKLTVRVKDSTTNQLLNIGGTPLAPIVTGVLGSVGLPVTPVGSRPLTAAIPIKALAISPLFTDGYYTLVGGGAGTKRVYDIAVSPSPVWPGVYVA